MGAHRRRVALHPGRVIANMYNFFQAASLFETLVMLMLSEIPK